MATKLYRYDPVKNGIESDMFDGAEVGNLIKNGGWKASLEDAMAESKQAQKTTRRSKKDSD